MKPLSFGAVTMNFIKHVATAALLVALSASASVFADTVKTNTGNIDTIFNEKAFKNIPQNSQEVKRFVVPTNGIIALEIDGKVNLLSSNGRFVIQGTLYDTWAKSL
jgi:thiol:disulfide interchange protein DsbC